MCMSAYICVCVCVNMCICAHACKCIVTASLPQRETGYQICAGKNIDSIAREREEDERGFGHTPSEGLALVRQ